MEKSTGKIETIGGIKNYQFAGFADPRKGTLYLGRRKLIPPDPSECPRMAFQAMLGLYKPKGTLPVSVKGLEFGLEDILEPGEVKSNQPQNYSEPIWVSTDRRIIGNYLGAALAIKFDLQVPVFQFCEPLTEKAEMGLDLKFSFFNGELNKVNQTMAIGKARAAGIPPETIQKLATRRRSHSVVSDRVIQCSLLMYQTLTENQDLLEPNEKSLSNLLRLTEQKDVRQDMESGPERRRHWLVEAKVASRSGNGRIHDVLTPIMNDGSLKLLLFDEGVVAALESLGDRRGFEAESGQLKKQLDACVRFMENHPEMHPLMKKRLDSDPERDGVLAAHIDFGRTLAGLSDNAALKMVEVFAQQVPYQAVELLISRYPRLVKGVLSDHGRRA